MTDAYAIEPDAQLSAEEINAAYAWVEWPQRDASRLDAVSGRCTWFAARAGGDLIGVARVLDDGGLHASLWDLIVRPDRQRRGIGTALARAALSTVRDRRIVAIVSTPHAMPFFTAIGFATESHGHAAMYLRPGETTA